MRQYPEGRRNVSWAIGGGLLIALGSFSVQAQTDRSGGTEIVIAHAGPIYTMDAPVTWYGATHWLTNMLYDCLIWRAADGEGYVPQLAESWGTVAPDRWRFNIREGATFHNGEPINAETIHWNISRIQSRPDFMVHPQWEFIKEMEIIDEYTIDFVTDGPEAYFEYYISFNGCQILPPQYIEDVGEEQFARNPVGSGPFQLVEFTDSERYVFEAWDDYWGGRPELDRVIYQVIPERASQIAALLAGQVDLVVDTPISERQRLEAADGVKVVEAPSSQIQTLYVRTNTEQAAVAETHPNWTPTTADKRIRQAISHALDRSLLAEVRGAATPTLVRLLGSAAEVDAEKYVGHEAADAWYDPNRARELIREAGFDPEAGNRPVIYFDAPTFDVGGEKEVGEVMEIMLEEVGFDVQLNIMDNAAYRSTIMSPGNNRELIFVTNAAGPPILIIQYSCSWGGVHYYCDEDLEEINARIASEVDAERRAAMWEEWWEWYMDSAVTISLYEINRLYGMSEHLDWTPRADGWITPRDARIIGSE